MKPIFLLFCLLGCGWLGGMPAAAQEPVPFNGLLLDALERPIRGARIWTQDAGRYARTDRKGRFGLTDVRADDTLRIRSGKQTYLVPVAGRRSLRIKLLEELRSEAEESARLLDYGAGYVRQREYIGYDSRITGEELMRTGCTDILSALSGLIPGLNITENPADGSYTVSIRSGSYQKDPTPLYVIDGVIVPTIDHLQLAQVAYVVVMKDAAIYGFRGGNGAIVVRTKSAETERLHR